MLKIIDSAMNKMWRAEYSHLTQSSKFMKSQIQIKDVSVSPRRVVESIFSYFLRPRCLWWERFRVWSKLLWWRFSVLLSPVWPSAAAEWILATLYPSTFFYDWIYSELYVSHTKKQTTPGALWPLPLGFLCRRPRCLTSTATRWWRPREW